MTDSYPKAPTTISAMVDLGIADIKRLPKEIELNMDIWVETIDEPSEIVYGDPSKVCAACFAGAVMLNLNPKLRDPLYFDADWLKVFRILDSVRSFRLDTALMFLNYRLPYKYMATMQEKFNKSIVLDSGYTALTGKCSKESVIQVMERVSAWLKENDL